MINITNNQLPPWVEAPAGNRVPAVTINRTAQASKQTINVAAANQAIPLAYGRVRTLAIPHVFGTYQLSRLFLLVGYTICQGEIEEIEEIYLDGLTVPDWIAAGNIDPGKYNSGNVATDSVSVDGVECFLGTQTQGIPFTLTRGGGNDSLFTFTGGSSPYTDTNPGSATLYLQFDPLNELTRLPTVEVVYKAAKVYDPRDVGQTEGDASTYEWSPVAALILADFIDQFSTYDVNWDSVETAADWNTEIVSTGLQASSAQITAYNNSVRRLIGIAITKPVVVEDFVRTLSEYAGCFASRSNGEYLINPDKPGSSVASLTEDDFVQDTFRSRRKGHQNSPTIVRTNYTQPDDDGWRTESAETAVPASGIVRRLGLNMPGFLNMATATRQSVERLNKINLTDIEVRFDTFDEGLTHLRGDIIDITHSVGFSSTDFRVVDIQNIEPGRWRVECLLYDANVYSTTTTPDPVYGTGGIRPDIPDGPTITDDYKEFYNLGFTHTIAGNFSTDQGIRITLEYGSVTLPSGGSYEVQFVKFDEETVLQTVTTTETFAKSGNLHSDAPNYIGNAQKFRVRVVDSSGNRGAFGAFYTITAAEPIPTTPQDFTVDQVADRLLFSWLPSTYIRSGTLFGVNPLYDIKAILTSAASSPPLWTDTGTLLTPTALQETVFSHQGLAAGNYVFLLRARNGTPASTDDSPDPPVPAGSNFSDYALIEDVDVITPATSGQIPSFNATTNNYEPQDAAGGNALSGLNPATTYYQYSTTTTMADPGNGYCRFNNSTMLFVTKIAFDDRELSVLAGGATIDATNHPFRQNLENGVNKVWLMMRNPQDSDGAILWNVTGYTDNSGWYELDVTLLNTYGTDPKPSNDEIAYFHIFFDLSEIGSSLTDAQIETAYNNQVDVVTQAEAEAGTDTNVHRWTPQRVAQAIAAQDGRSYNIDTANGHTPKFLNQDWSSGLGSWTAVNASSGTVGFTNQGKDVSGAVYDTSTRTNCLLVQPDNVTLPSFRYDDIIDDGDTVVFKFLNAFAENVGNNMGGIGISLNTSDTGITSGTYKLFWIDGTDNGLRIFDNGGLDENRDDILRQGNIFYLRITRKGNTGTFGYSSCGEVWMNFHRDTINTYTNTWFFFNHQDLDSNVTLPIHGCHWIKHSDSDEIDAFPP